MLSHFSCVRLFVTLWTVTHQALLSMGCSRQDYWNGLPYPTGGIFLTQGSNLGLLIAGRNINKLRYADDTTLTAESEEELKTLLMKMKEESKKLA